MRTGYIELAGEKHPLCFSLSAIEDVCEEFGSVESMRDALTSADVGANLHAIDSVLTILLKAGRNYARAMGQNLPPELPCRPADVIDPSDTGVIQAIFDTITDGSKHDVDVKVKEKNAEATQSE